MGFYKLPKIIGKDNKPPFGARVNWHHPLAQGLIGAWLFNEGVGNAYNLVDKNGGAVTGAGWNATGFYAYGASKETATQYINCGHPSYLNLSKYFTVICYFNVVSLNSYTDYFFLGKDIAGGRSYAFGWYETLAGTRYVPQIQFNASRYYVGTSPYWTDFNKHQFGFVHGDANTAFYVDGKLIGTPATENPAVTATDALIGCRGYTNYNNPAMANLYSLYIWNRQLSSVEMYQINANPYQMFLHPVWDVYIIPAAVPPPTGGKSIFGYDSIFHAGGIIQT